MRIDDRSDEVAAIGRLGRIRETQPENPVIRPVGDFRKGQDMGPDLIGRRVDKNLVGDHDALRRAVKSVGHGQQHEKREDAQLKPAVIRSKPNPAQKQSGQNEHIKGRENDHQANDAFPKKDRGAGKTHERDPERVEKSNAKAAIEPPVKPGRDHADDQRQKKKARPDQPSLVGAREEPGQFGDAKQKRTSNEVRDPHAKEQGHDPVGR